MSGRAVTPMGSAQYLVVYYRAQPTSAWWTRLIDQRFVHVEVWWHLGDDYWVAVRPNHSHMTCDVMIGAPRVGENSVTKLQTVTCLRQATTPMLPIGMKTCVTVVKAVLGVRAAWVLTPKQLYRHIRKRRQIIQ